MDECKNMAVVAAVIYVLLIIMFSYFLCIVCIKYHDSTTIKNEVQNISEVIESENNFETDTGIYINENNGDIIVNVYN